MPAQRRAGAKRALASFNAAHEKLRRDLVAVRRMTRRLTAMRHRLEVVKARPGTREWQVKRRERTRTLTELAGPGVKERLVDVADDAPPIPFGALMRLPEKLPSHVSTHSTAASEPAVSGKKVTAPSQL